MTNEIKVVKRHFTKELENNPYKTVYDLFNWTKRDVLLKDYKTGEILFDFSNVEFPDFYSQNAVDIITSKYFRRAHVPETEHEVSLRQVVHRMVDYWTAALSDEGLLKTEEEKKIFYDEAAYLMLSQKFAPNSPQWFNTGVGRSYGVKGSQSELYHYYPELKKVKMCEHDFEFAQISACFILSIQDSLIGPHSISETYQTETKLFKGGSGTGSNFSNLRAKGEKLSGGGESSGVMSFLDGLDKNAGAIKSGGTCLAPWTLVKTQNGPIPVKELADKGEKFLVLSFNPVKQKIQSNEAIAFEAGRKELYKLTTDKGVFTMSYDHPVMLVDSYVEVKDLTSGLFLKSISASMSKGELYAEEVESDHLVVKVESLGFESIVYDVTVLVNGPNDRSPQDEHNFAIISEASSSNRADETGIFVHNTRRSAKMVSLDIDHPEIEDFITWKSKEEDKALALMKMGYDGDMNGEAYATVSGQNSNNSVRITDNFMKLVDNLRKNPNSKFLLQGRRDASVNKEILVRDLWEKFNESSWRCADPAPQFVDTFNSWHTCPAGEDGEVWALHNRLNSTNPCGEYAFLDDTSCNLGSINLDKFLNNKLEFKHEDFLHTVGIAQYILEGSVHWGAFPTIDIARRTYKFRTTGLGVANLASLLMNLGLPYDSHEARTLSAGIVSLMTGYSYLVSAQMAEQIGPFEAYELNKNFMLDIIRKHISASGLGVLHDASPKTVKIDAKMLNKIDGKFNQLINSIWVNALQAGKKYGYRNAQTTLIAPTGTIAFAMDCGATGIEPFFSHIAYKKLAGGGSMMIINPVLEKALQSLGYTPSQITDIIDFVMKKDENGLLVDGKIEGAIHLKKEHYPIFDTANVCGTGVRFIAPMGHVKMMAALSPHLSGAISKTVNLPNSATVDDFKKIHLEAWKMGVKGLALYRDGSKNAQPLNNIVSGNEEVNYESMKYSDLVKIAKGLHQDPKEQAPIQRVKIKGIRSGRTHPAVIENVKIYTTVNRNEKGNISEIYISTDREGGTIMGLLNALSKNISIMLQYGIEPEKISKILRGQKYEPHGLVLEHPYIKSADSISDLISKIIDFELEDYRRLQIKPTTTSKIEIIKKEEIKKEEEEVRLFNGQTCSECGSSKLVQSGTCATCLDCGSTTGCS